MLHEHDLVQTNKVIMPQGIGARMNESYTFDFSHHGSQLKPRDGFLPRISTVAQGALKNPGTRVEDGTLFALYDSTADTLQTNDLRKVSS